MMKIVFSSDLEENWKVNWKPLGVPAAVVTVTLSSASITTRGAGTGDHRADEQGELDALRQVRRHPGRLRASVMRNVLPTIATSSSGRTARFASQMRQNCCGSPRCRAARLSSRSPDTTVCSTSSAKRSGGGTKRRRT